MKQLLVLLAFFFIGYAAAEPAFCNNTHVIAEVGVPAGFCPVAWAENLRSPRGLVVVSHKQVLVIERGAASITALWDDNKDGYSEPDERVVLARQTGLNHGIAVDEARNWLYASTSTQVYRWAYRPLQRTPLGAATLIISELPCCGHVTRTLLLNAAGDIYVTSGSKSNVDQNDLHGRIHYFSYQDIQVAARNNRPIHWTSGVVVARGMRNEVGLTFDAQNRMWGVENGVDNVRRPELADNLSYDNPQEELNLIQGTNKFYGYPYCWSEGKIPAPNGRGAGTQWAHPQFMNTARIEGTDEWCQNPQNVVPPKFGLPAHSAPMDIEFYYGPGNGFPAEYNRSAFVSLHGSWNRIDPQGYAVVAIHFDEAGNPVSQTPFLYHQPAHVTRMAAIKAAGGQQQTGAMEPEIAQREQEMEKEMRALDEEEEQVVVRHGGEDDSDPSGGLIFWMHRPVGLGFGRCGPMSECLYVSSDASNIIMAVAHDLHLHSRDASA